MNRRVPSRNRLRHGGSGGQQVVAPPRTAAAGAPASVGLQGAPYGVYQLPSQVLAGPFPGAALAVPQTADLFFVDQPFLPTVRQYVPVGRGRAMGPNGGAGGRLLAPGPTIHPTFWAVTVWAKELIRSPGQPVPNDAQLAGAIGRQVSYYKVRVQWNEYPSRLREILIDAGTAVDLAVGPTTNLFVDLMAPDPASADPRPPQYDDLRVDVYIVASAWATSVPIGHATGRFTQALYFPEASPPGPMRCVRIGDGARTLQVLGEAAGAPATAVWSPDNQDGSALPPIGGITINTGAGELGTDIVEIPQNAKSVCFESPADSLFTVVQGLEL
ncbi:MAG: hypothetical protein Q8Q14_02785 [Gemmatimonadales bacterium]|nr:hypothetical protein [Gemmatimonadales bacterium]